MGLREDVEDGSLVDDVTTPVRLICLPAELSDMVSPPELAKKYIDGYLDPKRLNKRVLLQKLNDLGNYGYAGQYEQRPIPLSGGMFHWEKVKIGPAPPQFEEVIRFWDKAGTKDGDGACTAGVKMGRAHKDVVPRYWILDVIRGRWDSATREKIIKQAAKLDGAKQCRIGMEQEPGPIWERELVQMASGIRKQLRKVKIGDSVIGHDGQPHKVTAVHEQGELECSYIRTASGRRIIAEASHPFLATTGWVTVANLKVGVFLFLLVANSTKIYERVTDPIISIEPVGKLRKFPCRCLTIEDAESFVCNDFVVHNSGGKESAENSMRNLAGYRAFAERPTGDKFARADPFSVQVNADNVGMVPGSWNSTYLDEMKHFGPLAKFKDQIDASSGCFNFLSKIKKSAGGAGF